MSKDDSGGLMSSAGLVRYFESEDRNAINIDPKTLVAWGVVFGVVVQMLNAIDLGSGGLGSTALLIVLFAFLGLTAGMAAKAATQGEV